MFFCPSREAQHSLSRPWPQFVLALVMLALAIATYAPSFKAPIYFDDETVITQNQWIHRIPPYTWYAHGYVDSALVWKAYRPTLVASYWFSVKLLGFLDPPVALRLGSVVILWLCALLIFSVLRCLPWPTSLAPPTRTALALSTALLFLFHPSQTLGVVFIWKRSTLLFVFFLFLGLRLSLSTRFGALPPWLRLLTHGLLFFLCVTSKEEGVIYPIFVAALSHLRHPLPARQSLNLLMGLGVGVTLAGILGQVRWTDFFLTAPQETCTLTRLGYFQNALSVMPRYLYAMVVPRPLILEEPLAICQWVTPLSTVTFLLASGGLFLWWQSSRFLYVRFALLCIVLGFLPNSSLQPLLLLMDPIRGFLPLCGVLALGTLGMWKLLPRRVFPIVIALITLIYAALSVLQSARYQHPAKIWADVVEAYPQSAFAYDQLGALAEQEEAYAEAAAAFERAARNDPHSPDYLLRALQNALRSGVPHEQIRKRYEALPFDKLSNPYVQLHLAVLEFELGILPKAQDRVLQFHAKFPRYAPAHFLLGRIFEKQGDLKNAWKAYANAALIDPNHPQAGAQRDRLAAHASSP